MQTELEGKFLNIDIPTLRQRLTALGAVLVTPERLMRRHIFDYPDQSLEQQGGWVRVRDEGDKVTMSYKQLNDRSLHGTKEATVTVSVYKEATDFLLALGLEVKAYQETRRESWRLAGVEVELDTWPWLPSFLELEGPTEAVLREVATQLKLDWSTALHGSVETAYIAEYDVTEPEVNNWARITFSPVPDWLESKRHAHVSKGAE